MHGEAFVRRLRTAPERTGLLFDVDGVLAPIVPRPEDARVPGEVRAELARLAARYALLACISGRTGTEAARIVGVEGALYVGAHGLELEPAAAEWVSRLREFSGTVDWPVEDKGLTVSFHYRGSPDEDAARATLEDVAERARATGLRARFGRKVLELRPPLDVDKGTAVKRLLVERNLTMGLYAGDDTTDLDAFRGLGEAGLDVAVRVAVASDEGPAELRAAAELVVEGPTELLELLKRL